MCWTTIADAPHRAAAAATWSGRGMRVIGSTSTRTGLSLAWRMAWTAPQKVIVGVSTAAPSGRCRARSDSSMAAVQELTATALSTAR